MDWFRAHHGITSDTKWAVIARKSGQCIGTVVSVWIAILDHASQNEDRGSLYGFDAETIDALYGYDDGVTASIITALETKGVIFGNRIVNWEKRQPEREDNSSERVRRFREKQQSAEVQQKEDDSSNCHDDETQCNALKRNVTHCNAPDKNREEQRREENISNIHKTPTHVDFASENRRDGRVDGLFEKFWDAYPRKESKKAAYEKFQRLKPDDLLLQKMLNWLAVARNSDQWQDQTKIPHPSTWLHQRRWEANTPPNGGMIRAPAQKVNPWEKINNRLDAMLAKEASEAEEAVL